MEAPYQIRGIELHEVNFTFPAALVQEIKTFHYNINIQHRVNPEKKLVFVDTSIEILMQDKKTKLAFLKASCIYYVEAVLDFRSKVKQDLFDLPQDLVSSLNTISISTTRGIMFAQFRGTYLHNAILPILDPNSLNKR